MRKAVFQRAVVDAGKTKVRMCGCPIRFSLKQILTLSAPLRRREDRDVWNKSSRNDERSRKWRDSSSIDSGADEATAFIKILRARDFEANAKVGIGNRDGTNAPLSRHQRADCTSAGDFQQIELPGKQ